MFKLSGVSSFIQLAYWPFNKCVSQWTVSLIYLNVSAAISFSSYIIQVFKTKVVQSGQLVSTEKNIFRGISYITYIKYVSQPESIIYTGTLYHYCIKLECQLFCRWKIKNILGKVRSFIDYFILNKRKLRSVSTNASVWEFTNNWEAINVNRCLQVTADRPKHFSYHIFLVW